MDPVRTRSARSLRLLSRRLRRAGGPVWVFVRSRSAEFGRRVKSDGPKYAGAVASGVRGFDMGTWRRIRLWVATGVLSLIAIVCAVSLALIAMAQEKPGWWKNAEPDSSKARGVALAVENGFVNHVYQRRDASGTSGFQSDSDGVWRVALTAEEANAWLDERLPAWFEHTNESWPDDLGEIRVRFSSGQIHVGASVLDGRRENVVSATLRPRIDETGSLWLPASSVRMGSLPVPMRWVFGDVERGEVGEGWLGRGEASVRRMPEAEVLITALSGAGPIVRDATVRLEDGRRVELLSVVPEEGRLVLTCRTR